MLEPFRARLSTAFLWLSIVLIAAPTVCYVLGADIWPQPALAIDLLAAAIAFCVRVYLRRGATD